MKELLNTYQKCFDHLIALYAEGDYYEEIKEAKNIYSQKWGKILENDPNYESRLSQFLDWYIFDYTLKDINKTPIQAFLTTQKTFNTELEKNIYFGMTKTIRSIFNVNKTKKDLLVIKNLIDNKKYEINYTELVLILKPKFIIDARLIVTEAGTIITKGFCIHPDGSQNFITKKIKLIKKGKKNVGEKEIELDALIKLLIEKYNLHLIYKHVEITKVYSPTPLFSK